LILSRNNVTGCEIYVAGNLDRPMTIWFAEQLKLAGLGGG